MSVVTSILDEIAEVRQEIADKENELEEKAGSLLAEIKFLKAHGKLLEGNAKSAGKRYAKSKRHTFVGNFLKMVWKPRKPVWDTDCLKAWTEANGVDWAEFEAACKVTPEGYYSIRKNGNK